MNLLDLICCPVCKSDLSYIPGPRLLCQGCDKSYEVNSGIPILIDLENVPKHLIGQIKYFENEQIIEKEDYKLYPWQEAYTERFEENFSNVDEKIIVDCGSGSGYMAIESARRGATVIACDLTLKGLHRLQAIAKQLNLQHKMHFVCCSAEELPFKSNIVDFFISNAVLEHLPNEKEAINEISRVCKKHAGCMVAVPVLYRNLNPTLLAVNYIHDKRIGHLRRYSAESVGNKFKGWSIKKAYYTGHTLKVYKTIINHFVYPFFDEVAIEKKDRAVGHKKTGASNIICILER